MDPAKLSGAHVRPARTEEDLAFAEKFLKTPRVREVVEAHPEERGCVRLCEADGEVVGALLIDPSSLRIRDVEIRCARIHETAGEDGRIRFRETGKRDLYDFMMEEFLGYLWARRYPIAYAHGELALYPAYGFAPCFYHPRVFVEVSAAQQLPAPYRVRHLKANDAKRMDDLRSKDRRWKPQVFASGVPLFHHFCIENEAHEVKGCFSLETNPDARWNSRFFAPEVDVADSAAARTLLRHCADKAAELGLKQLHFPLGPGHPVAHLCLELGGEAVLKGAATDPRLNEEMIHIADPCRLAEALGAYCTKRLEQVGAADRSARIPLVTERGYWWLEVDAGRVRIDGMDRRPEKCSTWPHWMFVQMLVGYRSVDETDVDLEPKHRSLLRALFPKTWPLSMPDADHWTTRMPPRPYTKEALAVVETIELPWTRTW